MHSRTYLLLESEYMDLQEANLYGISATPASDNFLQWIAKVQGLKDSLWEGAILQLSMKYTEKYNKTPPRITFNTIPFHPNVCGSSGKPCIDFLDSLEEWDTRYTMSNILLTVQTMLSNPVLENAVNMEAVEMLKSNPSKYRQLVFECVRASRALEAGVFGENSNVETIPLTDNLSTQRKIKNVSFDDYHRTWSEIATSQSGGDLKNASFADPPQQRNNSEWKKNKDDKSDAYELYNTVIHGLFIRNERTKESMHEKQTFVNPMRNPYLPHPVTETSKLPPSSAMAMATNLEQIKRQKEEPWEKEVDNLVDWTNSLNTDVLED